MSRIWFAPICGLALALSVSGSLAGGEEDNEAEPLQVLKSGKEHARLIYRVKALPVLDLETTIKQLFAQEGQLRSSKGREARLEPPPRVAIASCIISNALIISGPPDAVKEVQTLLDGLDQPIKQIVLDVEFGEAPIGNGKSRETTPRGNQSGKPIRWTERPAKMKTIGRVQLTTLDNLGAFAQMGARVPMVVGVSKEAEGEVRSSSMVNVGLILGVTPRITPDGFVVMEINAEQSQLGPEAEGVATSISSDKVVRKPKIDTTLIQSTVTVSGGQTIVLGAVARESQTDTAMVIVVTPHIIGPGEEKQVP